MSISNSNLSLNWEKLQNTYYRSRKIVDLQWPFNDNIKYAISLSFIAIEEQDSIQIYDYFGTLLTVINKSTHLGNVQSLEFDRDSQFLVVVTSESVKFIENWSPLQIKEVTLDSNIEDSIWDYKNRFIVLKQSQSVYKLDLALLKFVPVFINKDSYKILTKDHWNINETDIIILGLEKVYALNIYEKELKVIYKDNDWNQLLISPNGLVCLYGLRSNKVQIFRIPGKLLLEASFEATPDSIMWCGNDTIACSYDDEVKLYGPDGTYITFWFSNNIVALKTEVDGLKVFTSEQVHFISKIDKSTVSVFKIGSTEPGAILLDSWDLLERHPPSAIENIRNIDLTSAVNTCIDAVKDEFSTQVQKKLLKAASFGKDTLPYKEFDSQKFIESVNHVKVLNFLRNQGIFLTSIEFSSMQIEDILKIFLITHKYYECILLANLMERLDLYQIIFKDWAITKIKNSQDLEDLELLETISSQAKELPEGILPPMATIAEHALLDGRFTLSRELALLESRPESKIMALYKLDDDSLSIKESLKTRNPELILSLLLILKDKLTISQFVKLLILDMSDDQLYVYYSRSDKSFLFDYYRQTDNFIGLANRLMEQGKEHHSLISFLPQVQEIYKSIPHDLIAKQNVELIERHMQLVQAQESLSNTFSTDFRDLTLDQTLEKLINMDQEKYTKSLIKTFKINNKKYYHMVCRSLVNREKFSELYQFAKASKSPIGYRPFFDYLVSKGYYKEAVKYIDLISNITPEIKAKLIKDCERETH